jgi:hypothetical protein
VLHSARDELSCNDLPGVFWIKLCEKVSLERALVMPNRKFKAEQFVMLLRQIEV